MNLNIDNEFKNLIPALTEKEFQQLESNCIEFGIRDSMLIWKNALIEQGRKKQGNRTDLLTNIDKTSNEPKHNTRKILADELGMSEGKIQNGGFIIKNAPDFIKIELRG